MIDCTAIEQASEDSCSDCDIDSSDEACFDEPVEASSASPFFGTRGRRKSQSSPFLDRMEEIKLTEAEKGPPLQRERSTKERHESEAPSTSEPALSITFCGTIHASIQCKVQRKRRQERKSRKRLEQKRGVLKLKLTASALAVLQGATGWGSNPPSPARSSRPGSPFPSPASSPGDWAGRGSSSGRRSDPGGRPARKRGV